MDAGAVCPPVRLRNAGAVPEGDAQVLQIIDRGHIGNEDPEVLGIIDEERSKKGITARRFNNEEIIRRYIAAMVNEGAKVLFEKVVLCPSDIDVTKL